MHDVRSSPLLRVLAKAALLIAVALAPLAAAALAQPTANAPNAAATAPIAVADIMTRAEEEQQLVDRTRQLLAGPDPVGQLRGPLDDIARTVDAKLRLTAGLPLRELPVMRLESLARHWEFDRRRFQRWQALSRARLKPFTDSALELAQRRAAWSATRAEGVLDGFPPVLAERIDAILASIDVVEASLGGALERQFTLNRRASELQARIQSGSDEVDAAIDDIDRRLLSVDAPPLWQGLGATTPAALKAMRYGLDIEERFAIDYHAARTGNQQALRLLQIALLPLILWLFLRSRAARAGAPEDAPDRVARALRRPFSVWLLLSMLAVLVLEPDAPLLVQEAALLLAIVPVLRLLPAGTLRAFGYWPHVAVGLYVLDRLCVAAVAAPGWYRLLLLALNLLTLGLTLAMLRRRWPQPALSAAPPPTAPSPGFASIPAAVRLQRVGRAVAWTVLALLTVAAIANLIGNVSLAEMLTSGIIDSGYMALLLNCAVNACLAIVRAALGQPELARRGLVRRHQGVVQPMVARLLMLGATLAWLLYSADRFRLLRPVHLVGAQVMDLGVEVGEVSVHLGDVLVFALASWLAVALARGVRRLLRDELPGHSALPRGVGSSIASLSYYAVLVLGLLVALSAAGFKVSQLALVFGALGVGIGFGLQNVVNNFVSGLVLMFERPIRPGDTVDAAGASGTVRDIRLRSTTIRTFDGADVILPNGLLLAGNLTNWTLHDHHRRIDIALALGADADTARVTALLEAAVRATAGVAAQPPSAVLITAIDRNGVNFAVRAWTDDAADWLAVRSDLLARTLTALRDAGIAIPLNPANPTNPATPAAGAARQAHAADPAPP